MTIVPLSAGSAASDEDTDTEVVASGARIPGERFCSESPATGVVVAHDPSAAVSEAPMLYHLGRW
jgi:hypothetical protein